MPYRDQFTTDIYVNGDQARDALAKLETELEKLEKQYASLNKNSKNYETREKELAKQIKSTRESIKTAEKGTESYSRAMNNLNKRSIDTLIKMQRQLNSEIKKLDPNTSEFKKLSENYQRVTDRIKALQNAQKGISKGGFFRRSFDWLNEYYGAITLSIGAVKRFVSGFMEAYKTISNFEQANANLATILGVNKEQMELLREEAMRLGRTTEYTASQVTSLQTELAKLGFSQKEIIDMSPSVLQFATSVGTDLASAAQMAGVALRSFNLQSDQTEDVLGTMAVACNKSSLSFTYLQNNFSTIAPVAKTYGLSLKDTIALLGTLANAGFDASSAATATRNILLNLSDTNGKLAKALGGSVNSFSEIMDAMIKLRNQGVNLNETLELTDKRSVAAFNTFLEGAESAKTLRGELENVDGQLQDIQEQRLDTVEGSIKLMQSAWEGFVLSMSNSTGTIKTVIDLLTKGIEGVTLAFRENRVNAYADMTVDKLQDIFDKFGGDYLEQYIANREAEYDQLIGSKKWWKPGDNTEKKRLQEEKDALRAASEKVDRSGNNLSFQERLSQIQRIYDTKVAQFQADMTLSQEKADQLIKQAKDEYEASRKDIIKTERERMEAANAKNEETTIKTQKELTDKELAELRKRYGQQKQLLDAKQNYEEKQLKVQWLKGEIGEAEYNQKLMDGKADYYENALALAKKYGQDETAITNKMFDEYIKRLETEKKKLDEITNALEKVSKARRQKGEKKERDALTAEGKSRQREQEILEQNLADAKKLINESNWQEEYEFEKFKLQQLYDLKMMSESDLQKALLNLKLQYAQKAAEQVNSIAEKASDFVNALKDAESAKIEAEYQEQLTAAGDNAEQREQIEADYEQKKLDLNKKYADADMVINIAKAVASGAVAAVKAYEEGGPYLGPVLAALVAATTAAEVATIVAQRNAIKNASTGGSGGSGSSSAAGVRTVNGYSSGGFTGKAPSDTEPVGIVHANEWVAPAWMVRENPVTFANLEQYRKEGSVPAIVPKTAGFAEGGFTSKGKPNEAVDGVPWSEILEAVREGAMAGVKEGLAGGLLRAVVVRSDIKEIDDQDDRIRKQLSRN